MHDPVNSPSHYTNNDGGIECIEAIEASLSLEAFKGFLKGNAMKYLWRYDRKNGVEDLKKAEWYLDRLVAIEEMEEAMAKATAPVVNHDPDAYMISGCADGFCPMPAVRNGPPEPMFSPVS